MNLGAWDAVEGKHLASLGLVYGSERRRRDCIAWITDERKSVKAVAYGRTEAEARFAAYRTWAKDGGGA